MNPIDREECPDWQEYCQIEKTIRKTPWPDYVPLIPRSCELEHKIRAHVRAGHYIPLPVQEDEKTTSVFTPMVGVPVLRFPWKHVAILLFLILVIVLFCK